MLVEKDTPGRGARKPTDYSDLLQTNHSDAFAFSETEKRALELYDQLRELEMQRSLLEAQTEAHVPDVSALSDDVLLEQLITAQREAMEAKAEYELRRRIAHNVLVMDPVLKAVHGSEHTDFAEKRILPLITENDTLSMVHGSLAAKLVSTATSLSVAEQGNMTISRNNKELSQTLLALAEDMKSLSTEDIENPRLRSQVTEVEREVKESRRKKQTLKGTLSAMIVGSGVHWAEDEVLKELVMDDDEEG
ncbi:centromere protein H (CENP-H)-domain-containing protein [Massariosphaeria phaeospora]|uniref:Centromere protein H (CENP-H)-domain-containing protein n=1 Tax=Massariosphaeria phaeospora TaxID=100035 RepID=A0A7C8M6L2_9PLEO|nr:centromere protein H (CENP-H)-domain-containing protein [Massariosphaeria phaeospora]